MPCAATCEDLFQMSGYYCKQVEFCEETIPNKGVAATKCPSGSYCPFTDNRMPTSPTKCETGSYSEEGQVDASACKPCEDDTVTNDDQSACVTCPKQLGKLPNDDHSECKTVFDVKSNDCRQPGYDGHCKEPDEICACTKGVCNPVWSDTAQDTWQCVPFVQEDGRCGVDDCFQNQVQKFLPNTDEFKCPPDKPNYNCWMEIVDTQTEDDTCTLHTCHCANGYSGDFCENVQPFVKVSKKQCSAKETIEESSCYELGEIKYSADSPDSDQSKWWNCLQEGTQSEEECCKQFGSNCENLVTAYNKNTTCGSTVLAEGTGEGCGCKAQVATKWDPYMCKPNFCTQDPGDDSESNLMICGGTANGSCMAVDKDTKFDDGDYGPLTQPELDTLAVLEDQDVIFRCMCKEGCYRDEYGNCQCDEETEYPCQTYSDPNDDPLYGTYWYNRNRTVAGKKCKKEECCEPCGGDNKVVDHFYNSCHSCLGHDDELDDDWPVHMQFKDDDHTEDVKGYQSYLMAHNHRYDGCFFPRKSKTQQARESTCAIQRSDTTEGLYKHLTVTDLKGQDKTTCTNYYKPRLNPEYLYFLPPPHDLYNGHLADPHNADDCDTYAPNGCTKIGDANIGGITRSSLPYRLVIPPVEPDSTHGSSNEPPRQTKTDYYKSFDDPKAYCTDDDEAPSYDKDKCKNNAFGNIKLSNCGVIPCSTWYEGWKHYNVPSQDNDNMRKRRCHGGCTASFKWKASDPKDKTNGLCEKYEAGDKDQCKGIIDFLTYMGENDKTMTCQNFLGGECGSFNEKKGPVDISKYNWYARIEPSSLGKHHCPTSAEGGTARRRYCHVYGVKIEDDKMTCGCKRGDDKKCLMSDDTHSYCPTTKD